MIVKAIIYIFLTGFSFLGALLAIIASVVFAKKRKPRNAKVSAALAVTLGFCGLIVGAILLKKSYNATNRIIAENTYDLHNPDSIGNRKGFERYIGFAPGKEISQVYFYADEFGADVRYQLAFKSDKATIDRIISTLSLMPASTTFRGLSPRDDLPWWKPDSLKGRAHWMKEKNDEYYWDLWYSEDDQIAFYQEYSI